MNVAIATREGARPLISLFLLSALLVTSAGCRQTLKPEDAALLASARTATRGR